MKNGRAGTPLPERPPPCSRHPLQLPRLSPGDSRRAVPVPVGTRADTRDRNTERGKMRRMEKRFPPQRSPAARFLLPTAIPSPCAHRAGARSERKGGEIPPRQPGPCVSPAGAACGAKGAGGGFSLFPACTNRWQRNLPVHFMLSGPVHERSFKRTN